MAHVDLSFFHLAAIDMCRDLFQIFRKIAKIISQSLCHFYFKI